MYTDTHCHISTKDYNDIDSLIKHAIDNGINRFINNATGIDDMYEVLELANKYKEMYAAIGFHPENADKISQSDLDYLEKNLANKNVIAMGEIGLDYYYTKENKSQQINLFEYQLYLAQKHNLPVIIHNRNATDDIIQSLSKYKVSGVIHCFNGSIQTAEKFISMGFLLGINGVITFKNCKLKEVIKQISPDNIVLETDCPYLTPEPYRGKKNDPKYIKVIAEYVADLYKLNTNELEIITNQNIKRVFDI